VSDEASSHPFDPGPSPSVEAPTAGGYEAPRSRFEPPTSGLPPLRDPYDSSPRRSSGERDPAPPSGFSPLADPYWSENRASLGPGQKPRLSQLAVTSVLTLLLGPVGSLASIVFGWAARREIKRAAGAKRGRAFANAGLALGCAFTLAWGVGLGWFVTHQLAAASRVAEASESDEAADPATHDPPDLGQPPDPGPGPIPNIPIPGVIFAPKTTKTAKLGGIEVVDIGQSVSSLSDELAKQRAAGAQVGQKILVMTTAGHCDPCRGVDKALQDPLLQSALEKTRLVRVDVDVFHEDLQALKMPVKAIPGFFLLSPDLTPKDAINGGEWDEDIPPNIAPVLGAFMRGKYAKRREGWKASPSSGIRL
jgi:Domain of unknown function (DUF4190)